MPRSSSSGFGLDEVVGAALSVPLVSLALALLVAGGILVVTTRPGRERHSTAQLAEAAVRSFDARYAPEHRMLGIAALLVVVLFVVENVIRGYVLVAPDLVAWWRFAVPVFCAAVGLSMLLVLIVSRGTTSPEVSVVPAARRTWSSFSPRTGLIGASVALVALLTTTIAAGLASAANHNGQHVWLEIPIPNEAAIDPIRLGFYGWTYGVPVLVCLAALVAVTWAVLHSNAARPYIRPETVAAERDARREVAVGAVRIATAGMLLALAGAWRLIAGAGSGSSLVIIGQNDGEPYEVAWRYAEFAVAAGWSAPVLEVTAFVLLLLVAGRLRRTPGAGASAEIAADAEVVR